MDGACNSGVGFLGSQEVSQILKSLLIEETFNTHKNRMAAGKGKISNHVATSNKLSLGGEVWSEDHVSSHMGFSTPLHVTVHIPLPT